MRILQSGDALLPFNFDLAVYGNSGSDYMSKFGYNASVGTSEEPIWAESGVSFTYPSTAQTMTISSANANDTSAGTGARTVYVEGLDGNYIQVSETATLNGQTGVTLANTYLRVHRVYVVTAGSGGKNAGIIYVGYGNITTGKPATVQASIVAGVNQTLQAIYTIPAGKTGYLFHFTASSSAVGEVRIYRRDFGGVFRINRNFVITTDVDRYLDLPIKIPEKSDIEIRGLANTSTVKMSATMEIVLK